MQEHRQKERGGGGNARNGGEEDHIKKIVVLVERSKFGPSGVRFRQLHLIWFSQRWQPSTRIHYMGGFTSWGLLQFGALDPFFLFQIF